MDTYPYTVGMNRAEEFEKMKFEYIREYKRTTGRVWDKNIKYVKGWVHLGVRRLRYEEFWTALKTLKNRRSFEIKFQYKDRVRIKCNTQREAILATIEDESGWGKQFLVNADKGGRYWVSEQDLEKLTN